MTVSISREEALAALTEALEAGDTNTYFISDVMEPVEEGGMVIYWVGYTAQGATGDPEETDLEGDPVGFTRCADGTVQEEGLQL